MTVGAREPLPAVLLGPTFGLAFAVAVLQATAGEAEMSPFASASLTARSALPRKPLARMTRPSECTGVGMAFWVMPAVSHTRSPVAPS